MRKCGCMGNSGERILKKKCFSADSLSYEILDNLQEKEIPFEMTSTKTKKCFRVEFGYSNQLRKIIKDAQKKTGRIY